MSDLRSRVKRILVQVKEGGDGAVKRIARSVGDEIEDDLAMDPDKIKAMIQPLDSQTKALIKRAAQNIEKFATRVKASIKPFSMDMEGYAVGMDFKPVEKAGCYAPGGRYPLPSTALMTAVTARVAGVEQIFLACPKPTPEVLFASQLAGVKKVYVCGGAQAVGAFAYGTETIPRVDLIAGPGNAYVTEAKRQVQGLVGVDMLAGPSEVAIIADQGADPQWILLDVLAQLEHDPDARAWVFTTSKSLAKALSPAPENCAIGLLDSLKDCVRASNLAAPEHLLLSIKDPMAIKSQLTNYGALFMGYEACVPFGDYMAGPNHTLPTHGAARFSSGLSPLTFMRSQSWFRVTGDIKNLARDTAAFAALEGLKQHQASAEARQHGALFF